MEPDARNPRLNAGRRAEKILATMAKSDTEDVKNGKTNRIGHRRAQILEKAAQLFRVKGYDSTSMSDIADEVGITKAGLYYFVESKEHLLYLITDYGLDLLDETVLQPLEGVSDPRQQLEELIKLHVHMILNRPREVTIILHEHTGLTGIYREKVLQRKKQYIDYVRKVLAELQKKGEARRDVDVTAATFFLLGALNWVYQWYKADGRLSEEDLARELTEVFCRGFLVAAE
jgi:TetR/AcrR family transcriptional regulator, cholesterol catabolism regulator